MISLFLFHSNLPFNPFHPSLPSITSSSIPSKESQGKGDTLRHYWLYGWLMSVPPLPLPSLLFPLWSTSRPFHWYLPSLSLSSSFLSFPHYNGIEWWRDVRKGDRGQRGDITWLITLMTTLPPSPSLSPSQVAWVDDTSLSVLPSYYSFSSLNGQSMQG